MTSLKPTLQFDVVLCAFQAFILKYR